MTSDLTLLPIFQDLPKPIVVRILKHAVTKQFKAGDYLVREGETGQEFFVIQSGTVEVSKKDGSITTTLSEGDGFGEIALIERVKRTASVRAKEAVQVVVLEKKYFDLLFLPGSSERKTLTQNIRQPKMADPLKRAA